MPKGKRGWFKHPVEHGLAAKGVKTKRHLYPDIKDVEALPDSWLIERWKTVQFIVDDIEERGGPRAVGISEDAYKAYLYEADVYLDEIKKRELLVSAKGAKTEDMFARGSPQRAVRDVLARKLEDEPGIEDAYALATHMVKQKRRLDPKYKPELVAELLEQYGMAGIKLTKKRAEQIAETWIRHIPAERRLE